ncbi:MAG: peptidase [Cyanobacteria bacterium RYN_339]|nr:peptidase [Cyanobacteria bacterium RYN_339]
MTRSRIAFAVALATVASAGCANIKTANVVAGVITAAQGLSISDAQEQQIGAETKLKVLAEMPEYPNPTVQAYVTQVGQKMAVQAQADRKGQVYEFHIVQNPEINAFATPGGFVFVTTGALKLMTNEAQLAGVLGHEVGHVANRHSVRGMQETLLAQGVSIAVLGQDASQLVQQGANVAFNLLLKGFDRGKEEEADRFGAKYSFNAGYDCRELGNFLAALAAATGETPAWLVPVADHPRSDDRIKELTAYIAQQKYATDGKLLNADAFQGSVTANLTAGSTTLPVVSPTPAAR